MTDYALLIQLLRKKVCDNENITHMDLSSEQLNSLYNIAKSQDLAHIVGEALQECLRDNSSSHKKLFDQAQMQAVYRYAHLTYELKQIYDVFEKNAIKYMPLKGAIIRDYYPSPELRTSCDIDILVSSKDLDKAINCLVSEINYTFERRYSHDVSLFSPSKVHLELHFNLIENNEKVSNVLQDIWENSSLDNDSEYRYIMSNEFFVVYHIAHMAEHFTHGGCGVRNFLDLWIAKNKMKFDEQKSNNLLQQCGLIEFSTAVFQLANVWFDNSEHSDITREIESYVFSSGIYGTMENRVAISQAETNGKTKYIFRRLFLPYSKLKGYYPKLEKHPILLPYYQIVRWVDFIFNKNKKRALLELKYNKNVDQEKKKQLKKLMNELNLSL